tara:strand:+ start:513 stop:875 length:363 start_codon:yes stop_codon:yes gene_type:complete
MTKKVTVFCEAEVHIPMEVEVEVDGDVKDSVMKLLNEEKLVRNLLRKNFNLVDFINCRLLKCDNQYFDKDKNDWEWAGMDFSLCHNGKYPEESPFKGVKLEDVVQRGKFVYIKEGVVDGD